MIESIVVGVLVTGAALFAGRKLFRPARSKTRAANESPGCACDGCPGSKGGAFIRRAEAAPPLIPRKPGVRHKRDRDPRSSFLPGSRILKSERND